MPPVSIRPSLFLGRPFAALFMAFAVAVPSLAQPSSDSGKRGATDLLPETTVAYAHVPKLGDVVETIINHPLRETIESMPVVQAVRDSADVRPMRDGLAAFEGSMGRPWNEAIALLTDGGIHLALDGSTEGAVLMVRSSSRDQLERFRSFLLAISQLGQGNLGIAKQAEYRGYTAYAMGDNLKMALMDDWFLVTNNADLGKSIIDRYVDGGKDSLAQSERFATALAKRDGATAKAYIDLQTIRDAGVAPDLYAGKTENIAAEAIFGGIVSNLQHAPMAVASLNVASSGIKLTLATPHRPEWGQGREYFFGEDGSASAPPLLNVPDQIFALSSHRDLSQMWLRAPDLMTDKANEDLAQADTGLTTFFSGLDFGEDVLGSLQPGIQLVVTRQAFDEQKPKPAIKLPSFAMQFRMQNPDVVKNEFRRVFQNVIGFINVVGAMQGQPQLDLGFEQSESITMVTSTYVPPRDTDQLTAAPINYNFSPTIAFVDDRMVIASTTNLAKALTETTKAASDDSKQPNTRAVLQAKSLATVLGDNRPQLVAQNMLEKGHGPEAAEAEIGVLFDVLGFFQQLSFDLDVEDDELALTAQLKLQTE